MPHSQVGYRYWTLWTFWGSKNRVNSWKRLGDSQVTQHIYLRSVSGKDQSKQEVDALF
jgi:hypothetical protein